MLSGALFFLKGFRVFPICGVSCAALDALRRVSRVSTFDARLTDLDLEVKGETTDASASDRATPACAALRAPQSLPPSPAIPITSPASLNRLQTWTCSGKNETFGALTTLLWDKGARNKRLPGVRSNALAPSSKDWMPQGKGDGAHLLLRRDARKDAAEKQQILHVSCAPQRLEGFPGHGQFQATGLQLLDVAPDELFGGNGCTSRVLLACQAPLHAAELACAHFTARATYDCDSAFQQSGGVLVIERL